MFYTAISLPIQHTKLLPSSYKHQHPHKCEHFQQRTEKKAELAHWSIQKTVRIWMKIKYICSPQLTAICNVKLTFLLLMKSSRLQMNWYIYVQWMYTCACERSSNLSITNTILSLASVPFFTSFSPFHPHKWANVARYTGTIIVSMFICMPLNMYFKLILDKNSYPFHFWISFSWRTKVLSRASDQNPTKKNTRQM